MTRVLFVNRYFHPDQSATSQMLSDLAFGLSARGMPVVVLCSRQRYTDSQSPLPAREVVDGVTVHRLWSTRFGRDGLFGRAIDYLTFHLSAFIALVLLLRRGYTVVAKTDPPLLSLTVMPAARLRGAHLVNWLQDIFPEVATELGANPLPARLDQWLQSWRDRSWRGAHCNVVLGERMRERLLERSVPPPRIAVIPNWADMAGVAPTSTAQSRLRSQVGLQGHFIVAYSGNLGRAHEFDTILAAAARLRQERDIRFLMIGAGDGMARLQRAVLEQGLDNFRFLGYQPRAELSDSLAAADVHLISLRPALEGLIVPSKFYGVLAAGRPAVFIGSPDGELGRIIAERQVGFSVPPGDGESLAACLLQLRGDAPLREAMGRRAFELYGERYTMQRAVDRWQQLLGLEPQAAGVIPPGLAGDASVPSP